MTATAFILFVLIGAQPAQRVAAFPDIEAGLGQVESLRAIDDGLEG